ncbi:hypothetical protein K3N28_00575 [Glycomyces sp. TRM65418]|nr:hypothetical protein [Glycomyces sp. TRM65418]MCC3761571.1 hypothetical protein [Glycomyces sp. TRM65418]
MRGLVGDAEGRWQLPPGTTGGQDEHDRREHLSGISSGSATALGAFRGGRYLTLPIAEVAEGYKAMDERRAIKVLLQP